MYRFTPSLLFAALLMGGASLVACSSGGNSADGASAAAGSSHYAIDTRVEDGMLQLDVSPGAGLKINLEFPWALTVGEQSLSAEDTHTFRDELVRYRLPVPEGAGAEVEGMLRFSVCNDATCYTPRERVVWQL